MLEQLLILGVFVLYLALPAFFVKEKDWNALLVAMIVGVVAGLIGAFIETLSSQYIPSFHSSRAQIVLFAPLLEEALKFLGCLMYLKKRRTVDSISKSMVFGYRVGLCFGLLETLGLTVGAPLYAILPRVFLTMPMHTLAASVSAYGIGYALHTGKRLQYSLLWLVTAFSIHALFNGFAFNIQL
jgi:RsiW-degrading membrane proteinase PrsW (M82 family)